VACAKPPKTPFRPKHGVRPFAVGNGTDYAAQVTSNTTAAEGTFDSVSGLTSESDGGTSNMYSLQLNTNPFSTSACSGAASPAACQGWEQFVYDSQWGIYIQYWMLTYNHTCPTGWNTYGADCWVNAASGAQVPTEAITSLDQMTLYGAAADGTTHTDTITLTVGGTTYTANGDNHFTDLASGWRDSEFNVFGDGNGSSADFNSGVTLVVRTRVNSNSPSVAPGCTATGYTGETNNLTLVSAPATTTDVNWPSIVFTESNNSPTTAMSCDSADSLGDTHIRTFHGLFYDFQASGEFVLARDGNDFEVHARQASGAPKWPHASVNKAMAVRMGSTRVELHIEPTRLLVDGKPHEVGDGKDLLFPDGVQISRRGNMYAISSANGNSVHATLNSTWMDLHVGLGRSKDNAHGLLANHNNSVHELATAGGKVLKEPIDFNELYHAYADSWRVSPSASLFHVPTTIKPGVPGKPFEATHLTPQQHANSIAKCKAAGITLPALLEACTLDHAVLDHDDAVKVFLHHPAPVKVIKPVQH
jgi:hypothetical protein